MSTPAEIPGRGMLTNAELTTKLVALVRLHLPREVRALDRIDVALTHGAEGPYGVRQDKGVYFVHVPEFHIELLGTLKALVTTSTSGRGRHVHIEPSIIKHPDFRAPDFSQEMKPWPMMTAEERAKKVGIFEP